MKNIIINISKTIEGLLLLFGSIVAVFNSDPSTLDGFLVFSLGVIVLLRSIK